MGRTRCTYGAIQKCIQNLVGKPESKRPLGRPRRRTVGPNPKNLAKSLKIKFEFREFPVVG